MSNLKFVLLNRKILLWLSIFTIFNLFLIAGFTIEETAVKFENINEYEPLPGRKRTQSRKPGGYREDSSVENLKTRLNSLTLEDS